MVRNLDHLLLFNLSICFEKLSSSSESSLSLSRTRSSISSEDSDSFVSFLFLSILVLLADREAEGHNLFKRQSWHFGEGEEQICCPNPTSKRLILSQYFLIERTHQKKRKKKLTLVTMIEVVIEFHQDSCFLSIEDDCKYHERGHRHQYHHTIPFNSSKNKEIRCSKHSSELYNPFCNPLQEGQQVLQWSWEHPRRTCPIRSLKPLK